MLLFKLVNWSLLKMLFSVLRVSDTLKLNAGDTLKLNAGDTVPPRVSRLKARYNAQTLLFFLCLCLSLSPFQRLLNHKQSQAEWILF